MTNLNTHIRNYAQVGVLTLSLVSFGILAGCVSAKMTPNAAVSAVSSTDAFAAEVASMTAGTTAIMDSPFGAGSQVRAGDFYTSGLGQTCRRASVSVGGESYRVVICRDGESWYTVAPIFEGQAR